MKRDLVFLLQSHTYTMALSDDVDEAALARSLRDCVNAESEDVMAQLGSITFRKSALVGFYFADRKAHTLQEKALDLQEELLATMKKQLDEGEDWRGG